MYFTLNKTNKKRKSDMVFLCPERTVSPYYLADACSKKKNSKCCFFFWGVTFSIGSSLLWQGQGATTRRRRYCLASLFFWMEPRFVLQLSCVVAPITKQALPSILRSLLLIGNDTMCACAEYAVAPPFDRHRYGLQPAVAYYSSVDLQLHTAMPQGLFGWL